MPLSFVLPFTKWEDGEKEIEKEGEKERKKRITEFLFLIDKSEIHDLSRKVIPPGRDTSYRMSPSFTQNIFQKPLDVLCSVEGNG